MLIKTLFMSAATAALLSGAAIAQDATAPADPGAAAPMDPATEAPATAAPTFTSLEEMTVGQVIGMRTESPDGEAIGEIDYVVEGASGLEAVIGIGGFLGLGEYTVALPLSDFELNQDYSAFVVSATREELQALPEIDESELESLPAELVVGDLMQETATDGEPAAAEPMAEEPAAEEPMAEEPAAEEPAAEETPAEEPMTEEESAMEEPAADPAAEEAPADEAPAEDAEAAEETEMETSN